ncbi:axoneme-associated protein MST101(2) protein [Rhynchospora pubera]|uniref:Axoneme-associated protein MST101(2) protein n=1 Tax=Rhynchospora pubera TaxID=906938 RepID=A0AAV8CE42_9POAL|nr:axoneme-associated protein MST101(2) protein [Rhynchospora pubera]
MVKSGAARVVRDSSSSYDRASRSDSSRNEYRNFMKSSLADMYSAPTSMRASNESDSEEDMDIKKLLKEVEYLGASNMTWKERKKVENRNIVALGGKPVKKHRTPLSVAMPIMKKQKQRDEIKLEEERILGKFTKGNKEKTQKKKPEDRVLKATEGHFRKGVLDVKHLFGPKGPKHEEVTHKNSRKGKKKGGKGKKGKRKGR